MSDETNATRKSLLEECTEKVEMRWVWVRGQGVDRPAVLLLDARDAHARAILETSGDSDRIGDYVAEAVRRGVVPMISWGLSREVAQDLISAEFTPTDAIVNAETGDGYVAVVVAAGGVSVFAMPPVPA